MPASRYPALLICMEATKKSANKGISVVPEESSPGVRTNSITPPADYERRILLCVAGLSPQVITETFYALATRENSFIPTEVHVVTTSEGAHRIRLNLLEADPDEQHFQRLCADLDIDPADILFGTGTLHQIPASSVPDLSSESVLPAGSFPHWTGWQQATVRSGNPPLDDIRSLADNEAAADAITAIVRDLTADPKTAIHASIAGGRKTMGFYLGYAISLFGREQDRLSHVLVSSPFESHPQFYYPPRAPKVLRDKADRSIHTRDAEVTLADIPFVRLRGHLDSSILGESMSYSKTVLRTQRNVNLPKLSLDSAGRTIYCGDQHIAFSPSLFAFYAWFARRLLAGKPGIHWSQDDTREEYLAEYLRVVSEYSVDYENIEKVFSRAGRMDEDFFAQKASKINRQLRKILGTEPASPYLISKIGVMPGSRRGLKGLKLKKEQVRFLGE